MSRAVVALGANLGDRGSTLRAAAHAIAALPGVRPVASSREVESVALTLDGLDETKPRYRNGVVVVDTDLAPQELLEALHGIEDAHGRTREVRWGDRTLDLDVVAIDDLRLDTATLTVPHPRAGSGRSCSRRGSMPTRTPCCRVPDRWPTCWPRWATTPSASRSRACSTGRPAPPDRIRSPPG